jgi:hypothetical protein
MENLLQLYPVFKEEILLRGLYLQEEEFIKEGRTIVYTNFICSQPDATFETTPTGMHKRS